MSIIEIFIIIFLNDCIFIICISELVLVILLYQVNLNVENVTLLK